MAGEQAGVGRFRVFFLGEAAKPLDGAFWTLAGRFFSASWSESSRRTFGCLPAPPARPIYAPSKPSQAPQAASRVCRVSCAFEFLAQSAVGMKKLSVRRSERLFCANRANGYAKLARPAEMSWQAARQEKRIRGLLRSVVFDCLNLRKFF